jgi:hypothetical protein
MAFEAERTVRIYELRGTTGIRYVVTQDAHRLTGYEATDLRGNLLRVAIHTSLSKQRRVRLFLLRR